MCGPFSILLEGRATPSKVFSAARDSDLPGVDAIFNASILGSDLVEHCEEVEVSGLFCRRL